MRIRLLAVLFLTLPAVVRPQNVTVSWSGMSEGCAITAVQSSRMVMASAGQPFVERASGSSRVAESGFLAHPALRGTVTSVAENEALPVTFKLEQNYPNPFNPTTVIRYSLPVTSHVSLKVYNILGQEVATLLNEEVKPGRYEVTWNAAGLASGTYFYRLSAGTFVETKKLILLK